MAPAQDVTEVTRRRGQITRAQLRQWWPHHVVVSADKVKGLRNSTTVQDFANTLSELDALAGSFARPASKPLAKGAGVPNRYRYPGRL